VFVHVYVANNINFMKGGQDPKQTWISIKMLRSKTPNPRKEKN
jgi:hypothetical protein